MMQYLLETGLTNALLVTVLAVIVWGITRLIRHPLIVSILWMAVLVKLVTPSMFAYAIPWPGDSSTNVTVNQVASIPVPAEPKLPLHHNLPPYEYRAEDFKALELYVHNPKDFQPLLPHYEEPPETVNVVPQSANPPQSMIPNLPPSSPFQTIKQPGDATELLAKKNIPDPDNPFLNQAQNVNHAQNVALAPYIPLQKELQPVIQITTNPNKANEQQQTFWLQPRLWVGIWLAGSFVWLTLILFRSWKFGKLVRMAEQEHEALQSMTDNLSERIGLRWKPPVRVVEAEIAPMIWAFGRQTLILFPKHFLEELTIEKQQLVLAHELAHLKRRDHQLRWLELLVLSLYWWLPTVRFVRRQLHNAQEECCDAWVLQLFPEQQVQYGETLLSAATLLGQVRKVPLLASEFGQKQSLKTRVESMLKNNTLRPLSKTGLVSCLLMVGLMLAVSVRWGEAEEAAKSNLRTDKAEETNLAQPEIDTDFKNKLEKIKKAKTENKNEPTPKRFDNQFEGKVDTPTRLGRGRDDDEKSGGRTGATWRADDDDDDDRRRGFGRTEKVTNDEIANREEIIASLKKLTEDPDPNVRNSARKQLMRLNSEETIREAVKTLLEQNSEHKLKPLGQLVELNKYLKQDDNGFSPRKENNLINRIERTHSEKEMLSLYRHLFEIMAKDNGKWTKQEGQLFYSGKGTDFSLNILNADPSGGLGFLPTNIREELFNTFYIDHAEPQKILNRYLQNEKTLIQSPNHVNYTVKLMRQLEIRDDETLNTLKNALNSKQSSIRTTAIELLGNYATRIPQTHSTSLISRSEQDEPELRRQKTSEKQKSRGKEEAEETVETTATPDFTPLIELLDDPDPQVRHEVQNQLILLVPYETAVNIFEKSTTVDDHEMIQIIGQLSNMYFKLVNSNRYEDLQLIGKALNETLSPDQQYKLLSALIHLRTKNDWTAAEIELFHPAFIEMVSHVDAKENKIVLNIKFRDGETTKQYPPPLNVGFGSIGNGNDHVSHTTTVDKLIDTPIDRLTNTLVENSHQFLATVARYADDQNQHLTIRLLSELISPIVSIDNEIHDALKQALKSKHPPIRTAAIQALGNSIRASEQQKRTEEGRRGKERR